MKCLVLALIMVSQLAFADVDETVECIGSPELSVTCGYDSKSLATRSPICSFGDEKDKYFNSRNKLWFDLPDGRQLDVYYLEGEFSCILSQ